MIDAKTGANPYKGGTYSAPYSFSPYRLDRLGDMGRLKMYWDIDAPDISVCYHYIAVVLDES